MVNIEVTESSPNSFSITVHGAHTTTHQVSVRRDYAKQLLDHTHASLAEVVHASFRFLLDRESNTSILRSFDLSVIERYFPDYPNTIAQYLD